MTLTAETLNTIVSGLEGVDFEQRCLEMADKHAGQFLKRGRGGLFFGQDTDHHATIGRIAKTIDEESWDRLQGQIAQLDKFVSDSAGKTSFPQPLPSVAIADLLSQTNRSGFYFGVAVALRIMGGAR